MRGCGIFTELMLYEIFLWDYHFQLYAYGEIEKERERENC